MGGHRTRKVRTLAPGPEGTEKTQDDEEKRDRRFGGCVSVPPCARDAVRNMRVTAKQRGREQEAGKYLRVCPEPISGGT